MRILFGLLIFILCSPAWAYPDFIGYSYRTCIVCHVSAGGGGALTDYGRALFAAEIAAKPLWFDTDDEKLAEYSRFLVAADLPWWLRLGYKYRLLNVEQNPGSEQRRYRKFEMQSDLNLNFFFNEEQSWGFISTLGYVDDSAKAQPNISISSEQKNLFWREYYVRRQQSEKFWYYVGFMDKIFGLRHPDHTAVNRARLGLGQNDQVHAFLAHFLEEDQDVFVQAWAGNAHLPEDQRLAGGSVQYEKAWAENRAYGLSVLSEGNSETKQKRSIAALHHKWGFGGGNSFLAELGTATQSSNSLDRQSAYVFSQGHVRLARGLLLESTGEYQKNDVKKKDEIMRWTLGFLYFPMQRFEFRFSARQEKYLNTEDVEDDRWSVLSQIHLSL